MSVPAWEAFARGPARSLPARTRLLDPRRPGPATVPTAYNQDGLIVSAPDAAVALLVAEALRATLQPMECGFDGPDWLEPTTAAHQTRAPQLPTADIFTAGVRLKPLEGRAGAPDPWAILTALRRHPNPAVADSVSLNHLLTSAEQVGGNPFAIGHGRVGLDSYGVPGFGGRGPVTFVGPRPRPAAGWRPRVVLLDTAIGEHPWFTSEPPVSEFSMSDGSVVGDQIHPYPRDDGVPAAAAPITNPLLGTLGSRAGHGTFIAGLLRQACPDVHIVALPVMGTDGVVPEHMLIRALDLVLAKQLDDPGWADAVVMSLGYYNETVEDVEYSSGLKALLVRLGRAGVAVFAAAGNDATSRPSYPAAFAVDPAFDEPDVLPADVGGRPEPGWHARGVQQRRAVGDRQSVGSERGVDRAHHSEWWIGTGSWTWRSSFGRSGRLQRRVCGVEWNLLLRHLSWLVGTSEPCQLTMARRRQASAASCCEQSCVRP